MQKIRTNSAARKSEQASSLATLIESAIPASYESEERCQAAIAAALQAAGVAFEREVRLSDRDRIDFMVGSVGVEVKLDGSLSALTRQLHRYAQSDRVESLLVVTTRARLARVPQSLNGKRVVVALRLGAFA